MTLILNTIKFIAKDIVGNVFYFPIWWYTAGAFKILRRIKNDIQSFARELSIGILFRYLFKPMYGLTDFWSRVISFMVRIVHFAVLLIVTIIWVLILLFLFLIWLALPLFVVYNLLYQIGVVEKLFI
ncbi:MAG: hypothetical protein V1898_03925 [Patescibacteria group bacterium]